MTRNRDRDLTASGSAAPADERGWTAYDAEGVGVEEERRRRLTLVRRLRAPRLIFAAGVAIGFVIFALAVFRFIGSYAAAFRTLSDRESIDDLVVAFQRFGVEGFDFLIDNHRAVALVLTVTMLALTVLTAAIAAGLFTRLYRSSATALYALYGQSGVVGVLTGAAMLIVVALPYLLDAFWSRGPVEVPGLAASLGYGLGTVSAVLIGMRAAHLATRPLPEPELRLADVGAPDRPPRAAVCARDPLARAAYERLLANNGFVLVFGSEYADETRVFFRRHGKGADVLILNDDVDDMPQLKFITHLADEAESAIGLVRLSPAPQLSSALGRRSDEPHGRIVAVEHVRTPTPRGPLIEAATRAANAARAVRDAAAPKSAARGEGGLPA